MTVAFDMLRFVYEHWFVTCLFLCAQATTTGLVVGFAKGVGLIPENK